MSKNKNFHLRENDEGTEVVHEIGFAQVGEQKPRLFHIFPVIDGELEFKKARVETMDGKIVDRSVNQEVFEQAQDWLNS
jgi:hypothetical protein